MEKYCKLLFCGYWWLCQYFSIFTYSVSLGIIGSFCFFSFAFNFLCLFPSFWFFITSIFNYIYYCIVSILFVSVLSFLLIAGFLGIIMNLIFIVFEFISVCSLFYTFFSSSLFYTFLLVISSYIYSCLLSLLRLVFFSFLWFLLCFHVFTLSESTY